jgi:hypothetical protein
MGQPNDNGNEKTKGPALSPQMVFASLPRRTFSAPSWAPGCRAAQTPAGYSQHRAVVVAQRAKAQQALAAHQHWHIDLFPAGLALQFETGTDLDWRDVCLREEAWNTQRAARP